MGGLGSKVRIGVVLVAVLLGSGACGDDGDGDGATTTTTTTEATTTEAPGSTTTTTGEEGTTAPAPTFDGSLEPVTAEPDGTGTAQLVAVRVGEQEGFTRFVLEFDGETRPGHDVRWVDGPVTEDGSGDPVALEGGAFLQVIVQPATGFDLEAGVPTYEGPTRLAGPEGGALTEAVRTGDFEAVLTWVLGAEERVPFRVSALGSPSRLVIDLQDA
jgi:hypothetical protein